MKNEWFVEWFDSPYYALLYQNHDEAEAQKTIDHLVEALQLHPPARVLDLACGKGRHARYLAAKGFEVTGLDISPNSIAFARQFEHEHLSFYQHDMRKPFRVRYYDAVVNMFTSFGYFKNEAEHLQVLRNVYNSLNPGGLFLLDFFNAHFVRENLVPEETKTVGGVEFSLRRWVRSGYVYKRIEFYTNGQKHFFQESVRLYELPDLQALMHKTGFEIRSQYGAYDLSAFDQENSRRLILIAKKT